MNYSCWDAVDKLARLHMGAERAPAAQQHAHMASSHHMLRSLIHHWGVACVGWFSCWARCVSAPQKVHSLSYVMLHGLKRATTLGPSGSDDPNRSPTRAGGAPQPTRRRGPAPPNHAAAISLALSRIYARAGKATATKHVQPLRGAQHGRARRLPPGSCPPSPRPQVPNPSSGPRPLSNSNQPPSSSCRCVP
jgi:hypothetical protein